MALCMFHLVTFGIVGNLFPVKKLFLTATFDGISRKKPGRRPSTPEATSIIFTWSLTNRTAGRANCFPSPTSALLDPLLIGENEKREGSRSSYFLIDQFDLTKAEDYLIAEFLIKSRVSGARG